MEPRDWSDPTFDPSKGPIQVHVETIEHLFNALDPQPLNVRDLDPEIASWIGEWAEEQHRDHAVTINIIVGDDSADGCQAQVAAGIQNHFAYRRWAAGRRLSRLLRDGRISLAIGLTILITLTTVSGFVDASGDDTFHRLAQEGLAVAGWVAMWRPMEIFLYEWWPLRREVKTMNRLARATIDFSRRLSMS